MDDLEMKQLGLKWDRFGLKLSRNGTEKRQPCSKWDLVIETEIFFGRRIKIAQNLKFLKKMTDCLKSQIHLFKTNVAEKTSRTLGTAHFIQIDIEYDRINRHF